jgi:3-deoxy-D-manno-octulosonic-acid transferase
VRHLYTLLLYLISPVIWLRLLWRGRKQPEYLQHVAERFGFYSDLPEKSEFIWVHAVSVGETRAAQPLIEALKKQWPTHHILLTCMTPTGRAAGRETYGAKVRQIYLPYDFPGAVDRFFRHFSPALGVLMETEIWPNLLAAAERRQIPVILANARLSERSARSYERFATLSQPAFGRLHSVAAQSEEDAVRLQRLGAKNVTVCGNLKFDVSPSAETEQLGKNWRDAIGKRKVWLAASTREGEEAEILNAWKSGCAENTLLVLVPRHPQRFAEVARRIAEAGFSFQQRSAGLPTTDTAIWLGDSMGEMVAYYHLADLAFIGGSLLPLGGQNLIEAAACGCPVLIGPHTFNFQQATNDALAAGAALRIQDAHDLVNQVRELLSEESRRQAMQRAAKEFSAAHRGATARTLSLIAQSMNRAMR